ncbi:hypothetical protein TcasGA2_TC001332 [Tribolium castaneum]|uniref:Uncharacterized protein n=1 Tax=Tribolium castaneum TaxID=7070 RepID=D6WC68_TRICA|nr:hypothetical protein TcasGA2_TC001332 [Tribolium castaneum]
MTTNFRWKASPDLFLIRFPQLALSPDSIRWLDEYFSRKRVTEIKFINAGTA